MARHESTVSEETRTGLKFIYRPGVDPTAPLVVLIHGRAGDRSVMWAFERSIPEDCHVVSFQAFLPDPLGGWSWWDMTTAGSKKEAILHAAGRLSRALEAFLGLYRLAPKKRIGMGFSQGSGLLSAIALRGFFDFDGIAVLAGFIFQPSELVPSGETPSIFVAHGSADETIPVSQAREGVALLSRLGLQVQYVEEEVGHKVGVQGTRALKVWLSQLLGGSEGG